MLLALAICVSACGGGGITDSGGNNGEINGDLLGRRIFPTTDPWNTAIDQVTVDPNSANLIASIGLNTGLHPDFGANYIGGPFGIPYVLVKGTQTKVGVTFDYSGESDPGPYPIPSNAPIEDSPTSASP